MSCLKRLFFVGIFPVALGVAAWQGWSWWSWAESPVSDSETEQLVQIQIPSGTAAQQIGQDLEAAGLIRSTTAWKVWNRLQGFQKREGGLQAGTYSISPTQSMSEIADTIWTGDVIQTSFTIPEGWNRTQIAESLESQGLVNADDFLRLTEEIPYADFPWLPQGLPHLEGFLYPDTYQLPSEQIDAEDIVDVMLLRFEQVALPVYQQTSTAYSLLEWVNLASIVEKESVVSEERDTIAGVFAR
ncbi:MAG: endolytic transglycosylase MltG, partial [Cyanobacteria bacterium P01_F01_bin.116]